MKKVLCVITLAVLAITANAQKGEKTVGLNLGFGTEIKSVAIGAKLNYNITDQIQLSPSFNYFLKKDGLSAWEINADAHYLFPIAEKLNIYPLVGLTFTGWKSNLNDIWGDFKDEWSDYLDDEDFDSGLSTTTKIGLNLGGGISYGITEQIGIGAELKYSIVSAFDQAVFSINATYKF